MFYIVFAFWGALVILLIALAEFGNEMKASGIIGAVLLLILGFWVFSEGIQYISSQTTSVSSFFNATANTTATNMTITPVYSDFTVPTAGLLPTNTFLGLVLILIGFYLGWDYILNQ